MISSGIFEVVKTLTKFATDYFEDGAHRYYGGTIGRVFTAMKKANYKDPYKYAAELFDGTGSYGNGGAMRAAPAALYALRFSEYDLERFIVDVTRLTHTHPWLSVVHLYKPMQLDPFKFVDYLLQRLERTEYSFVNFKHPVWRQALDAYRERFQHVKYFLSSGTEPSIKDVVGRLGNNLEAINSVPTAVYVFLRSLTPIPGIHFESILLRCVVYSIGLGGDTDSIGCMATALAGAYIGVPVHDSHGVLPRNVITRCERYNIIEEYAQWLSTRI
uniref:ADP-ribosylhydrolase ARH3 n=1 Tax=Trichobilharzia regenti TaxID=157069 RepID=A0AA85K9U9_TRIRE|nr:unnamed protein product [Trichobilharzia regenti]